MFLIPVEEIEKLVATLYSESDEWLEKSKRAARGDSRDGGHGEHDAAMCRKFAAKRIESWLSGVPGR